MSVGLFAKLAKEAAPILENQSALKAAGKVAKYGGITLGVVGFGIYHMITGKGLVDVAGNVFHYQLLHTHTFFNHRGNHQQEDTGQCQSHYQERTQNAGNAVFQMTAVLEEFYQWE